MCRWSLYGVFGYKELGCCVIIMLVLSKDWSECPERILYMDCALILSVIFALAIKMWHDLIEICLFEKDRKYVEGNCRDCERNTGYFILIRHRIILHCINITPILRNNGYLYKNVGFLYIIIPNKGSGLVQP